MGHRAGQGTVDEVRPTAWRPLSLNLTPNAVADFIANLRTFSQKQGKRSVLDNPHDT
jgi:hypothetical protein